MNPIQKVLLWMANINPKQSIVYPLDEELIRRDQLIKGQQQQIQGLQAQLSRIFADKKEAKEKEKQVDYTQVLAEKIYEKEQDLKSKRFENPFSLRNFFYEYFRNKQFREKMEITDYQDKVTFGKFGDFLVLPNGYIGMTTEEGELVAYGRMLHHVIWKPDSMFNYMKRFRIPLAVDENRNSIPDIENEEIPDVLFDENAEVMDENGNVVKDENGNIIKGEYVQTVEYVDTLKSHLIKRDEIIRQKSRDIERIEKALIDTKHENDNLHRSLRMLENRSNKSQAELSSVLDRAMSFENKMGDMQRKVIKLTEMKATYESIIDRLENTIKNVLDKLEKSGDKTVFEKARAETMDMIEWAKQNIPETIVQNVEKEPIAREIAQPGQAMIKKM